MARRFESCRGALCDVSRHRKLLNLRCTGSGVSFSSGIKRTFHDALGLALALDLLAWTLARQGEHVNAAVVLGAAYRLWDSFGHQLFNSPQWSALRATCELACRESVGDAAFERALAHGRGMSLEASLRFALNEETQVATSSDPLTKRERQIAELIADGRSNRQIATKLVVSQRTVDGHVEHIFVKLGFNSRSQVAAWVAERRAD
jgi:DNA-binding CsgD family transcriptional regulator